MATNPTFFTDHDATIDHVSGTSSAQTEIASGTYGWGIGTKANIVSGAGARWGALTNVWTDPLNWTVVIVAKPDATKSGELSQILSLADPGGSYLLVSFFGDYASGGAGKESFAVIHYKSGVFRRGGFTTGDVCDGNEHVYIARRTGATFQIFVDGVEVAVTTLTVGTASLTGTETTPSLHCSGTYGFSSYINRQAPVGLVKFYNSALSDTDVATLSSDPWETGGVVVHSASGAMVSGSALLSGVASRSGGVVTHTASGSLVASAAVVSGVAARSAATGATISIPPLREWETGNMLPGESGITVWINDEETGALVAKLTNQSSDASTAAIVLTHASLVTGVTYSVRTRLASGAQHTWSYTAS